MVLVEMGLALLIMVLGAVLVASLAGWRQQRRNRETYVQDLRFFSAAFEDYYQRHHAWPPSSYTEEAQPADLAGALKETNWLKGSPFGGAYGWVAPDPVGGADASPQTGKSPHGVVTLSAFSPSFPLSLTTADLREIDAQIDDGDLATGRFRTGFNGWPVYHLEAPKP